MALLHSTGLYNTLPWLYFTILHSTLLYERAFFEVCVFNPCARSNRQTSLQSTYRCHEQEKKRQYEQKIREVEHSTFTPLVLSTTGGMGRAATTFYKRLAAMLSEKRDVPYSKMIGWIRCRMSFSLVRASVCQSEEPDLLLLKEHFTNLLNNRQLKASFRLSNLWLQGFVTSKIYMYFFYLYCHYKLLCITIFISYIYFSTMLQQKKT